jgi:hypothetical protein
MATRSHTHSKDCPDYKAAAADRAKRDADPWSEQPLRYFAAVASELHT